jgi:Uma2 family endonuclease
LPDEKVASFVPALVVEFLNRWRTVPEIDRRIPEYFEAGVLLAWVIDPDTKTAKVYTSPKRFKELDATGTLDGGKVLPGFKLPLADLFAATRRRKKKSR